MKAVVRRAIKSDSEAILNLIQELAAFEKEPESAQLSLKDIERYGFG